MSLTAANARLAGQLQAEIDVLTSYINNLQSAVAASAVIQSASVRMLVNGNIQSLESDNVMSVADSTSLLNSLISIYQADITALQTQLNAITA